jgi:hypothetical protein
MMSTRHGRARSDEAKQHFYSYSGAGAVDASRQLGALKAAPAPAAAEEAEAGRYLMDLSVAAGDARPVSEGQPGGAGLVRFVGSRTFYRDGEKWVDSRYQAGQETDKITLFSDEYFELIDRHAEAGKYFALGNRVVVILDGKAYETVE